MPSTEQDTKVRTSITDEAYSLITCFYNGVDELVYRIATQMARKRHRDLAPGEPVVIELEDVRNAGRQVIDSLKSLAGQEGIDDMQECFDAFINSTTRSD